MIFCHSQKNLFIIGLIISIIYLTFESIFKEINFLDIALSNFVFIVYR